MRLFGCSSSRYSKSGDMSTISESEFSSTCLEKQDPLTNHSSKEKVMNLLEEEMCSAYNGSICNRDFSLLQGQEWLPSIYRIEG